MRAVMSFAKRQKWISSSPFAEGDPLISKADENRPERVLSFAEEQRLLEACANPRAHGKSCDNRFRYRHPTRRIIKAPVERG